MVLCRETALVGKRSKWSLPILGVVYLEAYDRGKDQYDTEEEVATFNHAFTSNYQKTKASECAELRRGEWAPVEKEEISKILHKDDPIDQKRQKKGNI